MFAADVYELLEGCADASFVFTLGGEICFWSTAAEQLFGYTAGDVAGRTCDEVLHGTGVLGTSVWSGERGLQRCALDDKAIPTFELEVTTASGRRTWVNVSTIVFDDSRTHRRLIAHLCSDISQRKERERSFEQMMELSKQVISLGENRVEAAPVQALSQQEQRILRLFGKAKSSAQVARELHITLPTLRNHLHAINQKLRTHSRLEAVLHAMKRGLI